MFSRATAPGGGSSRPGTDLLVNNSARDDLFTPDVRNVGEYVITCGEVSGRAGGPLGGRTVGKVGGQAAGWPGGRAGGWARRYRWSGDGQLQQGQLPAGDRAARD